MIYDYKNINVIRIGLQPTENINEGKDVVARSFPSSYKTACLESYVYEFTLKI